MEELKGHRKSLGLTIMSIILIGILMFPLLSCKSIFGPKEEETEESTEGEEARIIVYNDYGASLDIYMDGIFQFLLGNDSESKIYNVSHDEHQMEAKIPDTESIVATKTIDVVSNTDYTWTIDDPPDINVSNRYGETLAIYMDGNYQFDLVDEENRWIIDVSYGERFLKAIRVRDDQEIASITIEVTENKDYSWTIE